MKTTIRPRVHQAGRLPERLLGVWAHPDDEAYLSAALMADVVDAGGEVTVVVVTDGELGFGDGDPRTVDERSRLRRGEMRDALARLGVSDVRFLGVPDGFVDRMDPTILAAPIAEVMAEVRPDLTVTFGPDGITGHGDHIATGLVTTAAWLEGRPGRLCYAAQTTERLDAWRELHDRIGVWMAGEPEGIDRGDVAFVIRADAERLDRKRAALACHASQTDGLATLIGEPVYLRWISEETFRSPAPRELSAAARSRAASADRSACSTPDSDGTVATAEGVRCATVSTAMSTGSAMTSEPTFATTASSICVDC